MPAASCRIMPARSISRCETISASFGFSFRMGKKNRDNRMGQLKESVGYRKRCSETGSGAKIQGRGRRKAAGKADFRAVFEPRGPHAFTTASYPAKVGSQDGWKRNPPSAHLQFILQRDLLK